MNKSELCILESFLSIPMDVSGVSLKGTDYIAFESHIFYASGVGFDEIMIVNHLKKKTYYWVDLRYSSNHPEPFLHNLHLLEHHLCSSHPSQNV